MENKYNFINTAILLEQRSLQEGSKQKLGAILCSSVYCLVHHGWCKRLTISQ